jgi:6-phosphogluconate dehydrogenase
MAMVGLGRMGRNMARRLARSGHEVVVWNRTQSKALALAVEEPRVAAVAALEDLAAVLTPPRLVWLMLPAEAVDEHLAALGKVLEAGDVVVEGGNSDYKDDPRRAKTLEEQGIVYLDAGVSGGVWGLDEGYCLMVGGPREAYDRIEPVLSALAQPGGHLYCGPAGSGHFVKMIHNGIEYGMMQAFAEGFELMKSGPYAQHHDFAAICRLWQHGSVVRSWLLELLTDVFDHDPQLAGLAGYVEDSGEGRWAVRQALETATAAPAITLSLMQRFRSRQTDVFGDRVLAALRNAFGGHAVRKTPDQGRL